MKKTYLLSYKATPYQALNSGFTFDLTLQSSWFWGLFTTDKKQMFEVPDHKPLSTFTDHWDTLIADRKPLKK